MIRDCVCSGDDKSRLISCQLKRYCKLNGKYIKLNEQEVIETETQEKNLKIQPVKHFGDFWLLYIGPNYGPIRGMDSIQYGQYDFILIININYG